MTLYSGVITCRNLDIWFLRIVHVLCVVFFVSINGAKCTQFCGVCRILHPVLKTLFKIRHSRASARTEMNLRVLTTVAKNECSEARNVYVFLTQYVNATIFYMYPPVVQRLPFCVLFWCGSVFCAFYILNISIAPRLEYVISSHNVSPIVGLYLATVYQLLDCI